MTKTPNPRKSAGAATVGLAAIGAIAGAVPAHAADTTSFPVSTNLSAVTGLLSQSGKSALPLQSIPVVGSLVQGVLATGAAPTAEGRGSVQPLARSAMPGAQAAGPASSSALSLTSLADLLPGKLKVAQVDKESLPLKSSDSNSVSLPVLGSTTSVLGLTGLL